jgi:hypothetical protein
VDVLFYMKELLQSSDALQAGDGVSRKVEESAEPESVLRDMFV